MKFTRFLIYLLALFIMVSCQFSRTSPQELAETMVAQTAAAASPTPLPTDTPPPTHTPQPTDTPIPTDTPTSTNTPTQTPTDTATPLPTDTPTVTPTPGPILFKDDFSQKDTKAWSGCEGCKWEEGRLLVGPYDPGDSPGDIHPAFCEACGRPTFYRMAVDVTFIEGYADRGFGLLLRDTQEEFLDLEVSSLWQSNVLWKYSYKNKTWDWLNPNIKLLFGPVKASYATNRVEVSMKPVANAGNADIYVTINGKTIFIINYPAKASKVGLVVGFHSIGVAFDNFEFEELERETK